MKCTLPIGLFVVLLTLCCEQVRVYAEEDGDPVKITLYPSAEPKQSLQYKLLPSQSEQIAGNAAVYYGKVKAEQTNFFSNRELSKNIDRWQKAPLEQLVKEEARVPSGGSIEFYLDRGARCRFCDWQMPIGDVQFFSTLLAQVQECRQFSRILAAIARIDIAHRRYDQALRLFQTNHALGRHMAEGNFIVSGLVGVAICQNMNKQVLEFIQQPDTPNLYWALTTLPSPLVDMRAAVELETYGLEFSYPELGNYEGIGLRSFSSTKQIHPELWKIPPSRRTPEQWKKLYYAVLTDLHGILSDSDAKPLKSNQELEQDCQNAAPLIRQYLISRGMDAAKIKSFSVYQTALVYLTQLFRDRTEDLSKYYGLPYPIAIEGMNAVAKHYREATADIPEELKAIGVGIKAAKVAQTRLDREIAVLRIFEALRIYGASHDGKLPERLNDVTEVPIPLDPVTGKPFAYQMDNGTAVLKSPKLRDQSLHYEITMAK